MDYEVRAITNRPYTAFSKPTELLLKSNCLIQMGFMQLDFNILIIKFPILPKHQNKFTKKT